MILYYQRKEHLIYLGELIIYGCYRDNWQYHLEDIIPHFADMMDTGCDFILTRRYTGCTDDSLEQIEGMGRLLYILEVN